MANNMKFAQSMASLANSPLGEIYNRTLTAMKEAGEVALSLEQEVAASNSVHIVGFFLDAEDNHNIDPDCRNLAIAAAARIITESETDGNHKSYLLGLLNEIADNDKDDLQDDVKELLVLWADEPRLSEIALDEEDIDLRVNAVGRMTDIDLLLDIASDADEEEVRQAAKKRIKEMR